MAEEIKSDVTTSKQVAFQLKQAVIVFSGTGTITEASGTNVSVQEHCISAHAKAKSVGERFQTIANRDADRITAIGTALDNVDTQIGQGMMGK